MPAVVLLTGAWTPCNTSCEPTAVKAQDIETIEVEIPAFLTDMVPIHRPASGLQAKYSLEYDMAAIAIDGRRRYPPIHQ